MARDAKKETADIILLPEGRLINSSLFQKDQFNEKSVPTYKIELAFAKGPILDPVIDKLLAHADETWPNLDPDKAEGTLNIDGGNLISGILDGDKLAAKRKAKGKEGTAYEGMWVIRANTMFNLHGEDAPGGIQVWDENVQAVGAANQTVIYPGCYGTAAVTIGDYDDDDAGPAMKFYLSAFQKTRDGEKLVSSKDTSTLFKPVGRPAGADGAAATGRRARKG